VTTRALDLPVLLPRGAECALCVDELGRELGRLDGVKTVEPDVARGLLRVRFDTDTLPFEELTRSARRIGVHAHCATHCPDDVHEHGTLDLTLEPPDEDRLERRVAHVTGLDCADCALKLEGALRGSAGVVDAGVNFGAATMKVTFDAAEVGFDEILERVRHHGYDTLEAQATEMRAPRRGFWLTDRRALQTIAAGVLVGAGFAAQQLAPRAAPFLFAAAMLAGGSFVARAAFYSVRARSVDMNVLMTLAVVGAAAIGQWSEAALVTFLFALGNVLQAATLERTRRAIRGLVELAPPEATVLRDGEERTVPVETVGVGDIVLARPGERLAVDGVVVAGSAAVNQAAITGESLAVARQAGDQVFAGSIVEGGSLEARATSTAADNTIAKIVHLVEEAQAQRAPAQGVVDRFAARYTPIVVAGAALVAFLPPLLGASFGTWFYRGLALLIISCPCALVISTPVSILAALGNATRRGVLIKGGAYLEQLAHIRAVAIDKTGTLTTGKPVVTDIVALNGSAPETVLAIAAACERSSEHPLARAIVARAAADGRAHHAGVPAVSRAHDAVAPAATRFRALTGLGVRADIDGRTYFVGRPELFGAHAADPALTDALARLEREGKTAVAVGSGDGALGVLAIADPVRAGAGDALSALRAAGVVHIALLTGDNAPTAEAVGRSAGIDDVRAGLVPADKVDAIRELQQRFDSVAMIGDGVNDAPALAAATLGIAMGAAGTDAALETADIALMGDDLAAVAAVVALSQRTNRVIRQNIAVSIAIKTAFLVLAPLGLVTLWMAVFADMGTSLAVIGNGLRLQRSSAGPQRPISLPTQSTATTVVAG
jgi:Cd2+/Zn2+-exporting ATPase